MDIWSAIDTGGFARAYDTFLLGLQGAVSASSNYLVGSPASAITAGNGMVNQVVAQSLPGLQAMASAVLMRATELGASDARGTAPGRGPEDGFKLVDSLVQRDAVQAHQIIRRQALVYSAARMRAGHQQALLKATGQVGSDSFSQLDRLSRRIGSTPFAVNLVRLAAAEIYCEAFVAAAIAGGHQEASVRRRGTDPEVVDIGALTELLQLFHPNTPYRLELAP